MQTNIYEGADAAALKALANHDRLRILALLRNTGGRTVSQIGDELGLATGSISFHLKKLAEAGFAEQFSPTQQDQRKSWWRAVNESSQIANSESEADKPAFLTLKKAADSAYSNAYARYLSSLDKIPAEFKEAELGFDTVLNLTAKEQAELGRQLISVVEQWKAKRPSDKTNQNNMQVLITLRGFPWIP